MGRTHVAWLKASSRSRGWDYYLPKMKFLARSYFEPKQPNLEENYKKDNLWKMQFFIVIILVLTWLADAQDPDVPTTTKVALNMIAFE